MTSAPPSAPSAAVGQFRSSTGDCSPTLGHDRSARRLQVRQLRVRMWSETSCCSPPLRVSDPARVNELEARRRGRAEKRANYASLRVSSTRERTPSFPYTRERCPSTVLVLRNRAAATSRFVRPAATSSATRRSTGVSSPDDGARPPIRASSASARCAHVVAPSETKTRLAREQQRGRAAVHVVHERPHRRKLTLSADDRWHAAIVARPRQSAVDRTSRHQRAESSSVDRCARVGSCTKATTEAPPTPPPAPSPPEPV